MVTDAPAHGKQYHDFGSGDDYPNQPIGSLEEAVSRFNDINGGIDCYFTAMQLTSYT